LNHLTVPLAIVTTSFQKDSNSFKLQGATFDKWIFPQKETGQHTKPSLLSYAEHFKLLLINVKLFEIDGFVRSRHPVEKRGPDIF
jgi:hypothetical protein